MAQRKSALKFPPQSPRQPRLTKPVERQKFTWETDLFINLSGINSKIPIRESEYPLEGGEKSERSSVHQQLHAFDISKISGTKEKGMYSKNELVKIAGILEISSTNIDKLNLSDRILKSWKERYPEDFSDEY